MALGQAALSGTILDSTGTIYMFLRWIREWEDHRALRQGHPADDGYPEQLGLSGPTGWQIAKALYATELAGHAPQGVHPQAQRAARVHPAAQRSRG